VAFDSLTD